MKEETDSKFNIIKKIIKILFKTIYNLLIVMCVLLILIIALQRVTDGNKSIAGYRIFRVVTGSMIPQYEIGEVVICKEKEGENIKKGDDIVYLGKYGTYEGKIIMHEVVAIEPDENGELIFHARGLNNSLEDPNIKEEQIYGVVVFKSKILTVLYELATSIYSSFIIITILVLNVFISFKFTGKEEEEELVEEIGEAEGEEEEVLEEIQENEDEETEKKDVEQSKKENKRKKQKKKDVQDKQNKESDEA